MPVWLPWLHGTAWRCLVFAVLVAVGVTFAGCAAHKRKTAAGVSAPAATASSDQGATGESGPQASIHISYAHSSDYLQALTVTKYSGAQILMTSPAGKNGTSSIVRFEGGIEVWQINVDKSVLSHLPVLDFAKEYQLKQITYGTMPRHFIQTLPESAPPEPLESDHFYVFEVSRGSGSMSWEAVKVSADGSLESYVAEPRAGTSYRLCCNVGLDFSVTGGALPGTDNPIAPDGAGGPGSSLQ